MRVELRRKERRAQQERRSQGRRVTRKSDEPPNELQIGLWSRAPKAVQLPESDDSKMDES